MTFYGLQRENARLRKQNKDLKEALLDWRDFWTLSQKDQSRTIFQRTSALLAKLEGGK